MPENVWCLCSARIACAIGRAPLALDAMHTWSSDAIVLTTAPHGEHAMRVSLLTREHGVCVGIMPGGQSRKHRPALQVGTHVAAHGRARLAEHMGTLKLEARYTPIARWMNHPAMLLMISSACTLTARAAPERQPCAELYESLATLTCLPEATFWGVRIVQWEVHFLAALGYGLDLSRCALSGAREGLAYVSPSTGRAVTAAMGAPWKDRLLVLPNFLVGGNDVSSRAIHDGLILTEFFLTRTILAHLRGTHRALPAARQRLKELVRQTLSVSGHAEETRGCLKIMRGI